MAGSESANTNRYTVDYIFENYVGGHGLWQRQQLLVHILTAMIGNIPFYLHMFTAFVPEHRCRVPVCEGTEEGEFMTNWTSFAIPAAHQSDSFLKEGSDLSQCRAYQSSPNASCLASSFENHETLPCQKFVYDRSTFQETLSTQLDLVCSDSYKRTFLDSTLMVGIMLGCLLGGPMGDKLGRRRSLCLAVLVITPVVAIGGLVASFEVYAASRLVTYTCNTIIVLNTHALSLELFSKDFRMTGNILLSGTFSLHQLVLALIVYLVRDWTYMHVWSAGLMAVISPVVLFCLNDSLHWIIMNGREEKANEMLLRVARINGKKLTEKDKKEIQHIVRSISDLSQKPEEQKISVLAMLWPKYLLRTSVSLVIWVTIVLTYYALALNATDLAGDIFLNFALPFLLDVFPILFLLVSLDRLGRRATLTCSLAVLGASCLGMAAVPKSASGLVFALYMIGRAFGTACGNTIWLFTAELYPTNLRVQAVAACSLASRVAGLLAPFVANLSSVWPPLPFLLLGVPALASAALALGLPEVKGHSLPETAVEVRVEADAEDFGGAGTAGGSERQEAS